MPWPVPTPRCAALLAAVAVTALLLPLGLVAAAALALAVITAVDAWSVRRAPLIERSVPALVSRGVPAPIALRAAAADERRLLVRQPSASALRVGSALATLRITDGEATAAASVIGRQRGVHVLPGVACASVGPMGLARVHHAAGPAATVRVYPDLIGARAVVSRLRRDLAGHAGRAARGPLGLGTDFESVREYTPDDDIRQLNWRASARLGRPMSNQYRLERDRDVICLVDCGRLMAAPAVVADVRGGGGSDDARTLLDVALDAVTVLALAADELGDRCGAIAFDAEVGVYLAARHRAARHVIDGLIGVQAAPVESDYERAFARVGGSRRALVVAFTDLVDESAARSLTQAVPMLAHRHAVVVAGTRDEALEARRAMPATNDLQRAAAVVAADMLQARARAAAALTRAGATVVQARAGELGERCLRAYLDAKSRGRV